MSLAISQQPPNRAPRSPAWPSHAQSLRWQPWGLFPKLPDSGPAHQTQLQTLGKFYFQPAPQSWLASQLLLAFRQVGKGQKLPRPCPSPHPPSHLISHILHPPASPTEYLKFSTLQPASPWNALPLQPSSPPGCPQAQIFPPSIPCWSFSAPCLLMALSAPALGHASHS